MGRAGWGVLFMTLISLAVAVHGIWLNNSIEDVLAENPTLDKLYDTSTLTSVQRTSGYEFSVYQYLDPNSTPLSSQNEDYYASSFQYTKTVLSFFKDFFVPFSVLGAIDGFPTIIIWIVSIIWDLIYALLIFEVVWRFDIFS